MPSLQTDLRALSQRQGQRPRRHGDVPQRGHAAVHPSTSPSRGRQNRRHWRPPRRRHRRHWRQARHRSQTRHRSLARQPPGASGPERHLGATSPRQARQRKRQGRRTAAIFMSIGMAGGVATASSTISRTGATASVRKGGVAPRPQITTSSTWKIRRRRRPPPGQEAAAGNAEGDVGAHTPPHGGRMVILYNVSSMLQGRHQPWACLRRPVAHRRQLQEPLPRSRLAFRLHNSTW